MALTVASIFTRFKYLTQDDTLIRWTSAELVTWLNEGYIQVVVIKPEANPKRVTVTLGAGPYQSLDDGGTVNLLTAFSLIKVVRNIGANKRAIREIDLADLNANLPDWYADTETDDIERWSFNPDMPREFLVYPPASAGATVEVIYADNPGVHTDSGSVESEALKLKDYYMPILVDYVLYRAYSKDADNVVNAKRAVAHFQTFLSGLGAKNQADDEQAAN